MKQSIKSIIICTMLFVGVSVQAAQVKVIEGTVQGESKTIQLSLIIDDKHDITALKVESNDPKVGYLTDTFQSHEVFDGIVLYAEKGRDIVELQSENFSGYQGGHVKLSYLYNGITGSRSAETINLYRDGDEWKVEKDGKAFSKVHFIKNKKRFVGVVGIRRIEFN